MEHSIENVIVITEKGKFIFDCNDVKFSGASKHKSPLLVIGVPQNLLLNVGDRITVEAEMSVEYNEAGRMFTVGNQKWIRDEEIIDFKKEYVKDEKWQKVGVPEEWNKNEIWWYKTSIKPESRHYYW